MAMYLWQTRLAHDVSDRTFELVGEMQLKQIEALWSTSEDGLLLYDLASAVGCRLDDLSDQYVLTLAALAETGREMACKRLRQADGRSDRVREVVRGMEAAKRRLRTRQQSLAYTVRAMVGAAVFDERWQEVTHDVEQ